MNAHSKSSSLQDKEIQLWLSKVAERLSDSTNSTIILDDLEKLISVFSDKYKQIFENILKAHSNFTQNHFITKELFIKNCLNAIKNQTFGFEIVNIDEDPFQSLETKASLHMKIGKVKKTFLNLYLNPSINNMSGKQNIQSLNKLYTVNTPTNSRKTESKTENLSKQSYFNSSSRIQNIEKFKTFHEKYSKYLNDPKAKANSNNINMLKSSIIATTKINIPNQNTHFEEIVINNIKDNDLGTNEGNDEKILKNIEFESEGVSNRETIEIKNNIDNPINQKINSQNKNVDFNSKINKSLSKSFSRSFIASIKQESIIKEFLFEENSIIPRKMSDQRSEIEDISDLQYLKEALNKMNNPISKPPTMTKKNNLYETQSVAKLKCLTSHGYTTKQVEKKLFYEKKTENKLTKPSIIRTKIGIPSEIINKEKNESKKIIYDGRPNDELDLKNQNINHTGKSNKHNLVNSPNRELINLNDKISSKKTPKINSNNTITQVSSSLKNIYKNMTKEELESIRNLHNFYHLTQI